MSTNKDKAEQVNKIVKFPQSESLFTKKAYELVKSKQLEKAVSLLEEAELFYPDSESILMAQLVAYAENSNLQKVIEKAEILLQNNSYNYLQVIDLYVTVLFQHEQYDEIQLLIERVLKTHNLPEDNRLYLLEISKESNRLANIKSASELSNGESVNIAEALSNSTDESLQIVAIKQLSRENVNEYMKEIKQFLANELASPFIKTILLIELINQKVFEKVRISKFGRSITVVPARLVPVQEDLFITRLKDLLSDIVENDDPILYKNICSLIDRTALLAYPLEFTPANYYVWAATFHLIGLDYIGEEYNKEEIVEAYDLSVKDLEKPYQFVQMLENTVYPNLEG